MPIDFPNSPTLNQVYTVGATSWTYDGEKWLITASGIDGSGIANNSVTSDKLASSVAGNGLSGGGGNALAVNVDSSTLEINSDTVRVKDAGITNAKLNNGTSGDIPLVTVSGSAPANNTIGKNGDIWVVV